MKIALTIAIAFVFPATTYGQETTDDATFARWVMEEIAETSVSKISDFKVHKLPRRTNIFPNNDIWYSSAFYEKAGIREQDTFFFLKLNPKKNLYPLFIQDENTEIKIPTEKTRDFMAKRLAGMVIDAVNTSNKADALASLGEPVDSPIRTFVSKNGKHKTKGRLVKIESGIVVIEKVPERVEVALELLSDADQEWIDKQK